MTSTASASSDHGIWTGVTRDGFTRFVSVLRWATAGIGVVWSLLPPTEGQTIIASLVLLLYAFYRTLRPINYQRRDWRAFLPVLLELTITLAAVIATGVWQSPLMFVLFTPVVAAGFARGQAHALRIAATAAITLFLAAHILDDVSTAGPIITWTGELLLVAVVASYGRTLLTRAELASRIGESQAKQLAQANQLLADLDRLARDLSVSFDFQETINAAVTRVRSELPSDVCVLILAVPGTGQWNVALAEGVRLPDVLRDEELPVPALEAVDEKRTDRPVLVHLTTADYGEPTRIPVGFTPDSSSGIYARLAVGERLIGVLALERSAREPFDSVDIIHLSNLTGAIALSVDNARWFERLQARGAARERTRIARDLHDRLGQGIAYLAFELERLTVQAAGGEPVDELVDELGDLRNDARAMVRELRETLSDLRTDVTDEIGLPETIRQFLDRVQRRSGLETVFESHATERVGLGQERELWRVAQEAITNVERHADATRLIVRWEVTGDQASIEVEDDGNGIEFSAATPATSLGRPSYGITGMRERAALLGAVLEIAAIEPKGTKVRLSVNATAYAASFTAVDEPKET